MKQNQIWPDLLYIVRHGESAGNVARDAAVEAGEPMIDIDIRDIDVPLSELGQRQAIALGRWFGALPEEQRPNIVLTSPYLRARHSAGLVVKTAGMREDSYSLIVDERFREKEFEFWIDLQQWEFATNTPIRQNSADCWASSITGRRAERAGAMSFCVCAAQRK